MGTVISNNPIHGATVENVSFDGKTITFEDKETGRRFSADGRYKLLHTASKFSYSGILHGAIELYRTRVLAPFELEFDDDTGRFQYLPARIPDSYTLKEASASIAIFDTPFGSEVLVRGEGCIWDEKHGVFCGFIGEEMFVHLPIEPY